MVGMLQIYMQHCHLYIQNMSCYPFKQTDRHLICLLFVTYRQKDGYITDLFSLSKDVVLFLIVVVVHVALSLPTLYDL